MNVLQDWMNELTWKMQSVILSGMRGPDSDHCPGIKEITRWIRRICQNDADPGHSYMKSQGDLPSLQDIEKEFEFCSIHFATHFLYALEIIGYKHPDVEPSNIALDYYKGLVRGMHFNVEFEEEMDKRLDDKVENKISIAINAQIDRK